MGTVLLAWEAGLGLGHLMNLRPLAVGLTERGHRMVVALRDLSPMARRLLGPDVHFIQAPFKHQRIRDVDPICTFAHVLHSIGFGDAEELALLAEAWRHLYRQIEPDLIVFDHGPTALLAGRDLHARKATIGTGFFCPPDVTPLPNLRTWLRPDPNQLLSDELQILENVNAVLHRWGQRPLDWLAQLYHPLDEHFLLTFAELDPYAQRGAADYRGMWSGGLGGTPEWPAGEGRRVFGYLKPFPALPQLLDALARLPNPTLLHIAGADSRLLDLFRRDNVRFCSEPVEMVQASRQCDLAILNATPATTVAMLLAGKPALHIPIYLEQLLSAIAAERLGAAIGASPTDAPRMVAALHSLLASDRFAAAAQSFATRYADYNATGQIERLVDQADRLAGRSGG